MSGGGLLMSGGEGGVRVYRVDLIDDEMAEKVNVKTNSETESSREIREAMEWGYGRLMSGGWGERGQGKIWKGRGAIYSNRGAGSYSHFVRGYSTS